MIFSKKGPKRRRYTRRELPYGQVSLWGKTDINFKREREARRAPTVDSNSTENCKREADNG